MNKQVATIIPNYFIKQSGIGDLVENLRPMNGKDMGIAGALAGGIGTAGLTLGADSLMNLGRENKKSLKERLRDAAILGLVGAGVGGVAAGSHAINDRNENIGKTFDGLDYLSEFSGIPNIDRTDKNKGNLSDAFKSLTNKDLNSKTVDTSRFEGNPMLNGKAFAEQLRNSPPSLLSLLGSPAVKGEKFEIEKADPSGLFHILTESAKRKALTGAQ